MKNYALYFLLLLVTLATGCQKEADLLDCPAPQTPITIPVAYMTPLQVFKLTTTQQLQVKTLYNSRISLYGGDFQFSNGQPLPSNAELRLEVREIVSKADMILNTTPTISNGLPLQSAGEYYLKVSYNGTRLSLRPQAQVFITTPPSSVPSTPDMQVFFGSTANNAFNWTVATDTISNVGAGLNGVYHMMVSNDSLGWINCDRFLGLSPITQVSIAVKERDVSAANTVAYLVFRNRNSVMPAYFNVTTGLFGASNIPEKEPVAAIVIRQVDNKFYFGREDAVVGTNQGFAPALREISEADLVTELKRL